MESVFTDAEKVCLKSLSGPAPFLPTDQVLTSPSPHQQRFVLAEMIKVSHMDVGTLVDFVKYHDIAPDWMEMQLPSGRFQQSGHQIYNDPSDVPPLLQAAIYDSVCAPRS